MEVAIGLKERRTQAGSVREWPSLGVEAADASKPLVLAALWRISMHNDRPKAFCRDLIHI